MHKSVAYLFEVFSVKYFSLDQISVGELFDFNPVQVVLHEFLLRIFNMHSCKLCQIMLLLNLRDASGEIHPSTVKQCVFYNTLKQTNGQWYIHVIKYGFCFASHC